MKVCDELIDCSLLGVSTACMAIVTMMIEFQDYLTPQNGKVFTGNVEELTMIHSWAIVLLSHPVE